MVHSSEIQTRNPDGTMTSSSGNIYELQGDINYENMDDQCFGKGLIQRFRRGIPTTWRSDLKLATTKETVKKQAANKEAAKKTGELHAEAHENEWMMQQGWEVGCLDEPQGWPAEGNKSRHGTSADSNGGWGSFPQQTQTEEAQWQTKEDQWKKSIDTNVDYVITSHREGHSCAHELGCPVDFVARALKNNSKNKCQNKFRCKRDLIAHVTANKDQGCQWHSYAFEAIQKTDGGPSWFSCDRNELTAACQPKLKKGTAVGFAFQPDGNKNHISNIEGCLRYMLEEPENRLRWCCPVGPLVGLNLRGRQYKKCRDSVQPFTQKTFLIQHIKDHAKHGEHLHVHALHLLLSTINGGKEWCEMTKVNRRQEHAEQNQCNEEREHSGSEHMPQAGCELYDSDEAESTERVDF